jgi:hypothetical protein
MGNSGDSGRIWLADGKIQYASSGYGTWVVPLAEIHVIGEYTNQNGPFLDDYFFAFVRSADEMWFEASFYAEGRDGFLKDLSVALGRTCECSLCASTDFISRIWWPESLAGQPLFEFKDEDWWRFRNKQYLSSAVKSFLLQEGHPPSS